MLSLYPGAVRTELVTHLIKSTTDKTVKSGKMNMKDMFEKGESIEFAGKIVVAMAQDPSIMKLSSKVVIGADYAYEKGIKDIDNRIITSIRQVKGILEMVLPPKLQFLANFVPGFIKIPKFMLALLNSKF